MSQCYHTSHNSMTVIWPMKRPIKVITYSIITWIINTYRHQMFDSGRVQFWNVWQANCFPQWIHMILRKFQWNSSVNTCVYKWHCNTNWLQRHTNDKPSRVIFGLRRALKAWDIPCEKHNINTLVVLVGSWVLSGLTDLKTPLSGRPVAWGCSLRGIMPWIHVTVAPHSLCPPATGILVMTMLKIVIWSWSSSFHGNTDIYRRQACVMILVS